MKIFLYVIVVIYFSSFGLTITRKCLTKMPIVSLTDIWQLGIASYGQQHFTVLGSLLLLSIKYLYKKIIDFINAFSKGVTFTTYWRAWVAVFCRNPVHVRDRPYFNFCLWQRVNTLLGLVIFLEPYTCGACGIQFQFYNNLLEHMQSHAGESTTTNACKAQQQKKYVTCTQCQWLQYIQNCHSSHITTV